MVGERSTQIIIWDWPVLDGSLNPYAEIAGLLSMRKNLGIPSKRFFLRVTPTAKRIENWFMDSPLGKNQFNRRIKDMCETEDICGRGFSSTVTAHSFRATMIT